MFRNDSTWSWTRTVSSTSWAAMDSFPSLITSFCWLSYQVSNRCHSCSFITVSIRNIVWFSCSEKLGKNWIFNFPISQNTRMNYFQSPTVMTSMYPWDASSPDWLRFASYLQFAENCEMKNKWGNSKAFHLFFQKSHFYSVQSVFQKCVFFCSFCFVSRHKFFSLSSEKNR